MRKTKGLGSQDKEFKQKTIKQCHQEGFCDDHV